jgi:hypothetical protein
MEGLTLLQKDIAEISDAIESLLGVGLDEIRRSARMAQDKYPAKVAFCYLLHARGYGPATIAGIMNASRSNVYGMLRRHDAMVYGDMLYKRSFEALRVGR